ncbi:MAG: hypothetical protein ACRC62_14065, partial [Microcoleus sp.]
MSFSDPNETLKVQPRPYDAVLGGKQQKQQPESAYLKPSDFDAPRLAKLVRNQRGKRGLKETAKEIGVHFVAIDKAERSHIKNFSFPVEIHFQDFLAICKWLGVPPAELVKTTALQQILADCGPQPGPYDAVRGGKA